MVARPRDRVDIGALPAVPQVVEAASARNVEAVLHFTRVTQGALGILAARMIRTRRVLPEDQLVQHVYEPNAVNAQRNRDRAWYDYVNLSISGINPRMFQYSRNEHADPDTSWCIFSFGIDVLGSPGAVFTTTNNTYSGAQRAEGVEGFEAMFSADIHRYNDVRIQRSSSADDSAPTDNQAEFLHLGDLPLDHLNQIYTQTEDGLEEIHGMLAVMQMSHEVVHAAEMFS